MVSTYENCPHQFKLKYIEKPDIEKIDGIEAFLGKRVHETLEKLHKELILSKQNSLDELIEFYKSSWVKNYKENIVIRKKGYGAQNYYDTGERAIKDYYRRYYPFSHSRTLSTEKLIQFKLRDSYDFRGYVDRLDISEDGIYEIHDYKTSMSLPDNDRLANDRQLALYHIGLMQNYRDAEKVRLVWHYLTFDKEFVLEKTGDALEETEAKTIELIKSLESDSVYAPKESSLCGWCDYPEFCPLQKHIVKTEILPVEEFLNDDGVTLANKYVGLKAQEKTIKTELEALKEQIIGFADSEDISKIRGSDKILNISEKTVVKFPASDEDGRNELEQIIKDAGKWDEVASLNTRSLQKILSNWDDDIQRKIQEYGKKDKEIKITIRNLKDED